MKIKKMNNFPRGLGHNYKTFRIVMLVKTPYPTFNQFVNALRGFNMREDETTNREEEIITSIQEKEASSLQDKKHVLITTKMDQVLRTVHQVKVMKGTVVTRVKFVVGITIHLLSIFRGESTLTKPKMSYHKHCLLLI